MTNTTHDQAAFQMRLEELKAARQAQIDALRTRLHVTITDQEMDTWEQQWDQSEASYKQQVREAHTEFGVPFLQSWRKALVETGKAVYHHVRRPYEGQHIEASIEQDTLTSCIKLVTTETYILPTKQYPTLEKIDNHISYRDVYGDCWEAVVKEKETQPQEPLDWTEECHPDSPLASPDEPEEERLQRLFREGTVLECLIEANYLLAYYLNVEDAELEPVCTAMDLNERVQSLIKQQGR